MIVEFFSINNEWDLLQLHLQEHSEFVDRFVITEGNHNYQQQPKPYRWHEKEKYWAPWRDKISYRQFDSTGLAEGWPVEQSQRKFGFEDLQCPEDTIFVISDVDEIMRSKDWPKCEMIRDSKKREILFKTECYYCFANLRLKKRQQAIAVTTKSKFIDATLHRRPHHELKQMPHTMLLEGGLHFTWFGDKEIFEEKVMASIEGHSYIQDRRIHDLWEDKSKGKLFHYKKKLSTTKFEKVAIDTNDSFSESIKNFIKERPDWILF